MSQVRTGEQATITSSHLLSTSSLLGNNVTFKPDKTLREVLVIVSFYKGSRGSLDQGHTGMQCRWAPNYLRARERRGET